MKNTFSYISLVIIHILIGAIIFIFEPLGRIYFILAGIYLTAGIFLASSSDKTYKVLLACAYFVGAEVFFRMTKTGLSYEASKYLVILFVVIGMFYKGISGKGYPYFIFLILLVPAIVVASVTLTYNASFRTNIAFVLSGPVCLGIASLFCFDRKIKFDKLLSILWYMLYPLITTTTYLFLYNPSIKDTLSGTASNAATSGGFGPNQVATTLGLGIFLIIVRLFLKSPTMFLKIFNIIILGAMSFRAIVTFSRGGVFAAIIVVAAFLWSLFFRTSFKQKNQIIWSFLLLLMALVITWTISSNQTSGLIDNRYTNKDSMGRVKGDISTGRLDLFVEEIEGFLESPFLGIGASRIKNIRVEETGLRLPSHNEIGRLLAEHGILGIIAILILIFTPLAYYGKNNKNLFFYAFLAFWFATINHSGMRIAAPSFIYALALLNVTYEKRPLYRKQIKQ
ncbi:O-antigen ligase family protein [Formosa maritima]|uniref:O-antigen ligase family protein n=1 Tax=Formosa maritima TaxID=2592046 RepID=A0A5D0GED3_9FLAO|nr:O-antigen ligase family protein [Formosa maritima]TYA56669.1 O-antigen ligase family protein [Formosa maritima]